MLFDPKDMVSKDSSGFGFSLDANKVTDEMQKLVGLLKHQNEDGTRDHILSGVVASNKLHGEDFVETTYTFTVHHKLQP